MKFLSLTLRCPSWRNVPFGKWRGETAVISNQPGTLVKALFFKKPQTPVLLHNPNPNPNPNPQYADQDIVRVKIKNNRISIIYTFYFLLFSWLGIHTILHASPTPGFICFWQTIYRVVEYITRGVTHLSLWAAAFVGWQRTNEVLRTICKIPWAWIIFEFAVGVQRMFPTVLCEE